MKICIKYKISKIGMFLLWTNYGFQSTLSLTNIQKTKLIFQNNNFRWVNTIILFYIELNYLIRLKLNLSLVNLTFFYLNINVYIHIYVYKYNVIVIIFSFKYLKNIMLVIQL